MRLARIWGQGLGSLGARPGKSILMALGITIGIAALTTIICISQGGRLEVEKKVRRFGARAVLAVVGHGVQSNTLGGSQVHLERGDLDAVSRQISGVEVASAYAFKANVSLKSGRNQTSSIVMSVDPNWHQAWDWPCVSGRELSPDDETKMSMVCVLGESVRRDLFGGDDPVGARIRLGRFGCTVVGVLETRGITGMAHDLDRRVLVPMSTGMKRLFRQRHLNTLRLKMKPGYPLDEAAASVIQLLNQRHQVDPKLQTPFSAVTSATLVKRFQGFSDTVQRLLLGLSALALLVGGGVLMNLMLASVGQRRHEIGLRRALGASARDIFQQFLCEAVTVSLTGLTAGWALGLLGAWAASQFFAMPSAVPLWGLLLGGGLSLAVGLAAGVLPARRAAALPPVDALR